MFYNYVIAIDGPSGTGKSTTAKEIASQLHIGYLDTGAMYRAYTLYFLENNYDVTEELASKVIQDINIELSNGKCFLNDNDVSKKIRSSEVTHNVSKVASLKIVRENCVKQQREIGEKGKWVVEGRDIGTNVFPKAKYKFFLTASPEVRAKRRWLQNGKKDNFEKLVEEIKRRDYIDSTRELNPLKKAENAIEIDTSDMTFDEVVKYIINIVK